VLFGIARATQLTAREVRSRLLGWLSMNATGVSVNLFSFEEPHAAVLCDGGHRRIALDVRSSSYDDSIRRDPALDPFE